MISNVYYILGGILLLGIVAGLLAGQFRRGVISELRAALESASNEIEINKGIVERLKQDVKDLADRCQHLEELNKTLTETIRGGLFLAPLIKDEFAKYEKRTIQRHRILAQHLPEPAKSALLNALVTHDLTI